MSDEPRFSREVYRGLLFLCGVVLPLALIALIVARVARRAAAEGDAPAERVAPAERDAPERPRSPLELEAAERERPPGDDGDDGRYPETAVAFEDITFPEALANADAPAMGISGFLCCGGNAGFKRVDAPREAPDDEMRAVLDRVDSGVRERRWGDERRDAEDAARVNPVASFLAY